MEIKENIIHAECRVLSSLEKVFCTEKLDAPEIKRFSVLRGERLSFQIACKTTYRNNIDLSIFLKKSPLAEYTQIREVDLVPCLLPSMPDDDYVITHEPGIFPDPLMPLKNASIRLSRRHWHALWVTVDIPESWKAGTYSLEFELGFSDFWDRFPSCGVTVEIELENAILPEQTLRNTLWFYADCLYTHYGVKCWSQKHWSLLERYFRNMTEHGINMLLTPLWTPPLDTEWNTDRPTAQLLKIVRENGKYRFNFSRLKRWIETARRAGIRYFEMSHAFSQWGLSSAPQIVVMEDGEEKKLFGWHVKGDSAEYRDFLSQLIPVLKQFLQKNGLTPENCYFHISDEPVKAHLENYKKASELMHSLLGDYPVLDALSDIDFYDAGLVSCPVPCTTHIEPFLERELKERWMYYCGNWENQVPNRQFGMYSLRNRILGVILYLYRIDGFLNWGYNFWFTALSQDRFIDPYRVTDAGRMFCGGGSFCVYPGEEGPVDSIHYEVFAEALQDLRALQALEKKCGRDFVVGMIQEGLSYPLTINRYPHEVSWLLNLRARVNHCLSGT